MGGCSAVEKVKQGPRIGYAVSLVFGRYRAS